MVFDSPKASKEENDGTAGSYFEDEKDFDTPSLKSQEEEYDKKPFLFYPDDKFKIVWDLFITL
jgi:hypothetical protein